MNYLSLIVELHHPLPGLGEPVGPDWATAAVEVYWPLIRVVTSLAERHNEPVLTLAVSPSWAALASDPTAMERTRSELDRRAEQSDAARSLRRFVEERWEADLVQALRDARGSGAVELITTTSSPAWLPSVAVAPMLARTQVRPAVDDHAQRFGARPVGIWLPSLSYLPGFETVLAGSGVSYFGVAADAFLRGTVLPPDGELTPMVTPPGVASFGVSAVPTELVTDPARRYARDPRYADPARAASAIAEHAAHFVARWREHASAADRRPGPGKVSVAALSAHALAEAWAHGPAWLDEVFRRLAWVGDWKPTTPGRYLDKHPDGVLGRPGPSAGGMLSVRPGDSDLLDRCLIASETLAALVERRAALGPIARRALAQMIRSLLLAQALDWHVPPGFAIGAEVGLQRAARHLARFHELAGLIAAGRPDLVRLAQLEAGPAYLPDIDLEGLASC